jgi:ubiquinol-cytochrome c reductase cytochrome b subunit
MVMVHLLFLHQTGSNNPLGVSGDSARISFHRYYSIKDFLGYIIVLAVFIGVILFIPNYLTDPENFLLANPLVTPVHIKPEWYFLWVYAILRSIPNKLGGVIALFMALVILFFLPHIVMMNKCGMVFYPVRQLLFWALVIS